MARLKNRKEFIPYGFLFVDPAIDAKPIGENYWTFDQLVQKVIDRRHQNPRFKLPTDFNTVANEVDAQNAERLKHISKASHFIVEEGGAPVPPPFTALIRKTRNALGAAVDKFANYKAGVSVGYNWFGSGLQPVEIPEAARRAKGCSTCPQNQPEDWMAKFAAPAIDLVKQQLEARADLQLVTPDDDKLHQCKACDCVLKLKVWTPMDFILQGMTEEKFARLDPNCWILAASK